MATYRNMSRFIGSFVVTIAVVLAMFLTIASTAEANTPCPFGYSPMLKTFPITPTCSVKIDYCYKCEIIAGATMFAIQVRSFEVFGNCSGTIDLTNQWIIDQLLYTVDKVCTPPACSTGNCMTVTATMPGCRQWFYNQHPQPVPPGMNHFFAWSGYCADTKRECSTTVEVCFDTDNNKIRPCIPPTVTTSASGPACPLPSAPPAPTYPQPKDGMQIPYLDCYDYPCIYQLK